MKSLLLLLLPVVLGSKKRFCEVNDRILGGENAEEGEFPGVVYLAGMMRTWMWMWTPVPYACAGSFISDHWVLTAAHCVSPEPPAQLISIKVYPTKGHRHFIESKNVIPLSRYPYVDDIGLIWLAQPMSTIDPYFKTVSLPVQDQSLTSNEVTLLGWGMTSTTDDRTSEHLKKLEHVALNQSICQNIGYSETKALCRYPTMSTGSTCYGDSGGPIFMDGLQVGIVSGMETDWYSDGRIIHDTRVSAYRNWIDTQTRSNIRVYF